MPQIFRPPLSQGSRHSASTASIGCGDLPADVHGGFLQTEERARLAGAQAFSCRGKGGPAWGTVCRVCAFNAGLGLKRHMKVLVVDDEPLIRLGLAMTVEDAGYDVVEAGNAAQAISCLEADDSIRAVLTDVDMPGDMDGIRLAHYVRHRWPPVSLVVLSGKVGVARHELPTGVEFLSKPFSDNAIRNLLKSLVPFEGGAA